MKVNVCDYLIVGGGIIGLTLARNLKKTLPRASITLIEKEPDIALHASGRNSGVLHAGFYYSEDSLKARFSREGNRILKEYCKNRGLKLNECGKVVVASSENELETLYELKKRGETNGVELELLDEKELEECEPNARTVGHALWSPSTATIDPVEICKSLMNEAKALGVNILLNTPYTKKLDEHAILAGSDVFTFDRLINAAGLYADHIARDFGCSEHYIVVPFKGIYVEYTGNKPPVRRNIYPVPNLANPFLGVHYTVKVDGTVEIGPTAMPAFWRENYKAFERFSPTETVQILTWEAVLFLTNAFGFRRLALDEVKKYSRKYLISLAKKMVKHLDSYHFNRWGKPGIRAQLLNTRTKELVQDFVVESTESSIHILNAVSPAFTCSISFTEWVINNFVVSK